MHLEVSSEECRLMLELLNDRMEELQPEIRRCRNFRYQEQLKTELDHLKGLFHRLESCVAEAPACAQ